MTSHAAAWSKTSEEKIKAKIIKFFVIKLEKEKYSKISKRVDIGKT